MALPSHLAKPLLLGVDGQAPEEGKSLSVFSCKMGAVTAFRSCACGLDNWW